jgi:Response regulator of citrate/malate metabolism
VVLVTADKNLALTAYNFDLVVDYLVKPLQKDRFMEAINQC